MFMFRSCRTNQLVNKLLQHEAQEAPQSAPTTEPKDRAKSLLKRLSESQLQSLLRSIEAQGGLDTSCGSSHDNCVVVASSVVVRRSARVRVSPKLLTCQLFRWPDLRDEFELKRLSFCQAKLSHHGDINVECCNPFHWSRLFQPNPASPSWDPSPVIRERLQGSPYSHGEDFEQISPDSTAANPIHSRSEKRKRCNEDSLSSEKDPPQFIFKHIDPGEASTCSTQYSPDAEGNSSSMISYSTNGTQVLNQYGFIAQVGHTPQGSRPWCRLAYWECKDRRGEAFPVISNSVDVFTHLPKGSGLCLQNVFGQSPTPKDKSVLKTRQKIGQGILLSHEESTGQVWVYNRTCDAIFVHSPTLDPPASRMDVVHKVPPGRSAQIFDYEKSWSFQRDRDPRDFPMDPYSVQISFVKGWGREYKRQDVLLCPCWLEIRMERRFKR